METQDLHNQIAQLKEDLEDIQEKNQKAAEYGLEMLQKSQEQQQTILDYEGQIEYLQGELENAKHEMHLSTKALQTNQSKTKKQFCEGEIRETDLDKQRRDAEERLATLEREKDIEVHNLQLINKSSKSEIERLSSLNNELLQETINLKTQRTAIRKDLHDMKANHDHLDAAYSELEGENCTLQEQVSYLKKRQVEYEGCKHENCTLAEEVEFLSRELEETRRLKNILSVQVEDAHETLQREREIKFGLKRELAQYSNIDLTGITLHSQLLDENTNEDAKDEDGSEMEHPLIRHITSDLIHSGKVHENGNDLYSELTFSEISKLKQKLCVVEKEKVLLINNLREQKVLMENKTRENDEKSEKDEENSAKLRELHEKIEEEQEKNQEKRENMKKLEAALKEAIENKRNLQNENDRLTAIENQRNVEAQNTCDSVQVVSDRISQIYHRLCLSNGEVPKQVVLESARYEARISHEDEYETDEGVLTADDGSTDTALHIPGSSDPTHGVLVAMSKQLDCLEAEMDALAAAKDTAANTSWSDHLAENQEAQEQLRILEEEILRLKSLLSSKREQIATLRTVLKANKHTAEVAISNLKEKYQHEKTCISDTMLKLRGELKALKEDAITFARLRMVFAARSDEYVAQLDAMQRQLQSAEDERRTLNTLLRKTITQKLGLTQRLEDLEFENEQQKRQGSSSSPCKQQQDNSAKKKASKLFLASKFRS